MPLIKTRSLNIALAVIILTVCVGIVQPCYGLGYRSDMLKQMAQILPVSSVTNDTTLITRYGNRDIVIRVNDGIVEHIGYRIFPDNLDDMIINRPVRDFVERYLLWLTLPVEREKSVSQQMVEDRVWFSTGGPDSVERLQRDTTLTLSCFSNPKEITVAWHKNDRDICRMTFPVNHELILGRRMIENDRRLPGEVKRTQLNLFNRTRVSDCHLTDSLSRIWSTDLVTYIDSALVSQRYYTADPASGLRRPVFSPYQPVKSIINMFTDYDIIEAHDIKLTLRHKIYGFKEQFIETSVPQAVAWAMQQGCIPFVGLVSIDDKEADILVIMHNESVGYNHVMRLKLPLESLTTGSGHATGRLNAFVPSSNIKNLFKE